MKTVQELRKEIEENEGTVTAADLRIEYKNRDVDFWYKGQLIAWVGSSHNDDASAGAVMSPAAGSLEQIDGLIAIAQYFGLPVADIKPTTITQPIVDKVAEARLAGKVEAYEKILIGREISAKA